jgi:hypothetical protein
MRHIDCLPSLSLLFLAGASDYDVNPLSCSITRGHAVTTGCAAVADAALLAQPSLQATAQVAALRQWALQTAPPLQPAASFALGQMVEARYAGSDAHYRATVVLVNARGDGVRYGLKYDSGELERAVAPELMRSALEGRAAGRVEGDNGGGEAAAAASTPLFEFEAHIERVLLGVATPGGTQRHFEVPLRAAHDPWRAAERFCFASGADDDQCALATAEVQRRYTAAFGPPGSSAAVGHEPTPAPACALLRAVRRPTPVTVFAGGGLGGAPDGSRSRWRANSGNASGPAWRPQQPADHRPEGRLPASLSDRRPVDAWLAAARAWAMVPGAAPVAAPLDGAAFDPHWPWDGRLGAWVSEPHRAVFAPPRAAVADAGQGDHVNDYGDATKDEGNKDTKDCDYGEIEEEEEEEEDEARWVKDLVAIALAPWAVSGITAADVDAAVLADPKVKAPLYLYDPVRSPW